MLVCDIPLQSAEIVAHLQSPGQIFFISDGMRINLVAICVYMYL